MATSWTPERRAKMADIVQKRQAARIEDIEFLLQRDRNAQSVARRAGFPNVAAATRFLARVGRNDLANQLYVYGTDQDVYHHHYASETFGAAS
ncbi:hypothetical protein ACFYE2_00655 [Kocuria sp. CPCC 205300]|uniref:hypothetical protein n=1 Tax=Kocuria sabuli TaxID=3071448 RepID=UPI0036DB4DB8